MGDAKRAHNASLSDYAVQLTARSELGVCVGADSSTPGQYMFMLGNGMVVPRSVITTINTLPFDWKPQQVVISAELSFDRIAVKPRAMRRVLLNPTTIPTMQEAARAASLADDDTRPESVSPAASHEVVHLPQPLEQANDQPPIDPLPTPPPDDPCPAPHDTLDDALPATTIPAVHLAEPAVPLVAKRMRWAPSLQFQPDPVAQPLRPDRHILSKPSNAMRTRGDAETARATAIAQGLASTPWSNYFASVALHMGLDKVLPRRPPAAVLGETTPLLDSKEISVRQAIAGPHRLLCVAAIMKEMDKMLRIYQAFRPIRLDDIDPDAVKIYSRMFM